MQWKDRCDLLESEIQRLRDGSRKQSSDISQLRAELEKERSECEETRLLLQSSAGRAVRGSYAESRC